MSVASKRLQRSEDVCPDAVALSVMLARCLQVRSAELIANHKEADRTLIKMKKLPRVSLKDVSAHAVLVDTTIAWHHDDELRKAPLAQAASEIWDYSHGWKLSALEDPLERAEFHRWEGDNLRMVWACFVRQSLRPKYSNYLQIFRL